MTKQELTTKWEKELISYEKQISELEFMQFHISPKLIKGRRLIRTFLEDIKQLNEGTRKDSVKKCEHPFVDRFINNDKAWCNKCKCWIE